MRKINSNFVLILDTTWMILSALDEGIEGFLFSLLPSNEEISKSLKMSRFDRSIIGDSWSLKALLLLNSMVFSEVDVRMEGFLFLLLPSNKEISSSSKNFDEDTLKSLKMSRFERSIMEDSWLTESLLFNSCWFSSISLASLVATAGRDRLDTGDLKTSCTSFCFNLLSGWRVSLISSIKISKFSKGSWSLAISSGEKGLRISFLNVLFLTAWGKANEISFSSEAFLLPFSFFWLCRSLKIGVIAFDISFTNLGGGLCPSLETSSMMLSINELWTLLWNECWDGCWAFLAGFSSTNFVVGTG